MKKTFTINISGAVFHIEEDAYELLQNYFTSLKLHFGDSEEGREIVSDIEIRIAELLSENNKKGEKVVTIYDVDNLINTMGTVGEIGEVEENTETENTKSIHGRKRLYRDPLHRYVGGVCGGLAAYFGMDRLLIRLIFFILIIGTQGAGLLAYIIMWIVVPKASTTAQRLEMHGHEVNVKNIEDSIRLGANSLQKSYENFKNSETYSNTKSTLTNASKTAYKTGSSIGRVLAVIVGVILIIASFLGLLAIISTFVFGVGFESDLVYAPNINLPDFINPFVSPTVFVLGLISIILISGIPLLAILYLGTKIVFRYNSNNKAIVLGMLGAWLLGIGLFVVLGISQSGNFKEKLSSTSNVILPADSVQTLYLDVNDEKFIDREFYNMQIDELKLIIDGEKKHVVGSPKFDIERSVSDKYMLEIEKSTRSGSKDDVKTQINTINYEYELIDSTLHLDPYFILNEGIRWRNQTVSVTLKVPEGKSVFLDRNLEDIIYDIENTTQTNDYEMLDKKWSMQPEGLTLDTLYVQPNKEIIIDTLKTDKLKI